jgi:hypothetical protein
MALKIADDFDYLIISTSPCNLQRAHLEVDVAVTIAT